MSWDAWIDDGKGAFPFGRPDPLDGRPARRQGRAVRIHALEDGARGEPIVESGRRHVRPSLPAARQGRAGRSTVRSFADLRQGAAPRPFVMLDPEARDARIREQLAALGGEDRAARPRPGRGVADLVEFPTVVSGDDPGRVPRPAGRGAGDGARPSPEVRADRRAAARSTRFAALTDTDGAAAARDRAGMERVVVARLRDAAFFFARGPEAAAGRSRRRTWRG